MDEYTQKKIMGDLRMSVDERADKYIAHLTEEFMEQQESVAELEGQVAKHMAVLGKTYLASGV